jgi:hypothetical protein
LTRCQEGDRIEYTLDAHTPAAYLGGHPEAIRPTPGELQLEAGQLRWTPKLGWIDRIRSRSPEPFTISAAAITHVEYMGDTELKKAPSGYLNVLGIVAHGYGGSQPKHPLSAAGRLKKMLVVRYRDSHDREYAVVFANPLTQRLFGRGGLEGSSDARGHELANRIVAATAQAHSARG